MINIYNNFLYLNDLNYHFFFASEVEMMIKDKFDYSEMCLN